MNLKAPFSSTILLCVLLGLTACATRNKPSDAPNPATSPAATVFTENTDSSDSTIQEDNIPSELESEALVIAKNQNSTINIDLLERVRRGFEFPTLESKHISQYEKWSTEHETYLKGLFERGTPFLFHIVEEIKKRQLPMELALLPAIESAYKPNAESRSSAGGLWQFIPSTGNHFGLHQNWWYDGRRDALLSTNAALDYLTQLNEMFDGDWFLTLAAYNAGPGTVSRAIKSNKAKGRGTRYQDLSLRLETRRYIPKLIALKNIINNPEKYGVTLPIIESKPYFEIVTLNGQIDLKKFAKDADLDLAELRHLNAGFKRWATPPNGPHQLLIPADIKGNVERAISAAQRAPKLNYSNHQIKQGDSLSSIAQRYGVSVRALKESNNLRNTKIRAGKNLLIPVRSSQSSIATSTQEKRLNPHQENNHRTHSVKRGDTLWSIARQYNVQLKKLMSWNNLSKNQILRLNQKLLVMAN